MTRERTYMCIDMKSFFASVECAERGLNPLTTNLVVADEERGSGTICLAVSPSMKQLGVMNRYIQREKMKKLKEAYNCRVEITVVAFAYRPIHIIRSGVVRKLVILVVELSVFESICNPAQIGIFFVFGHFVETLYRIVVVIEQLDLAAAVVVGGPHELNHIHAVHYATLRMPPPNNLTPTLPNSLHSTSVLFHTYAKAM